jgi:hypothetical protein
MNWRTEMAFVLRTSSVLKMLLEITPVVFSFELGRTSLVPAMTSIAVALAGLGEGGREPKTPSAEEQVITTVVILRSTTTQDGGSSRPTSAPTVEY